MILELTLEHTKFKGRRQQLQIFDIDACGIARVALDKGLKGTKDLVSCIIAAKLPSAYYNFKVVDWQFIDHKE